MTAPKLDLVHLAIRSGILGYIQWQSAAELLVVDYPELQRLGLTPRRIRQLLRDFVREGNVLDFRHEIRSEYIATNPDDPFWYRAIIRVDGLQEGLFIELKLIDDDPREPWIEIASAHPQLP